MILLNPGPVNLSNRVRNALLGVDLCHREPEFTQLQNTIRERLLKVYGLSPDCWAVILLAGSGTAAVEAMISSLVPEDKRLLIIENGIYGERISQIADIYKIPSIRLSYPWGDEIDLWELQNCLIEHPDITYLAIVHHETTTGRLNKLNQITEICKESGIKLLVDSVSSFGAEELDFNSFGISACAGTANKCLHSVPGIAFVIVSRDFLKIPLPTRSLYLNLQNYCLQQDKGRTPFTQPVQTFYALAEALAELEEQGGWQQRHQKYRELATFVRRGLIELGIQPFLTEESSSVVMNSYYLPDDISYDNLHDQLKAQGFVIYAGQGELNQAIFRISTMGNVNHGDMKKFLHILETIFEPTI